MEPTSGVKTKSVILVLFSSHTTALSSAHSLQNRQTPLHAAAAMGFVEIASVLLDAGASQTATELMVHLLQPSLSSLALTVWRHTSPCGVLESKPCGHHPPPRGAGGSYRPNEFCKLPKLPPAEALTDPTSMVRRLCIVPASLATLRPSPSCSPEVPTPPSERRSPPLSLP
jgi:hypothetical protein